jgi:WD40 repeat protein/serine/threonine protein kinase
MANDESVVDPVGQLAEEFITRYRRGERPALSEYTEQHPELAERIEQVFPMMVMMEEAGSGERSLVATCDSSAASTDSVSQKLERVGGFHIVREVGRGGMGVVYEAEQVALGRHVALKVLPLHAAKEGSGLERFRREARAAAKLHHSNIVPVYEVGEDGDYCYYAMQFIHGQPLDQILDEVRRLRAASVAPPAKGDGSVAHSLLAGLPTPVPEPVSPSVPSSSVTLPGQADSGPAGSNRRPYHRSVARVGIQVAQALAYAHQEGVIHRDIKPSNLLLDTESRVWITDFGLAKIDGAALTDTGDIVGTVRYMAPERFNGWSDPRSDVYSLGITLYEMLLLQPAFGAPDRMKLIHQVTHEEPPRPRKLEPSIPRDLETIVLKAIDKEPGRRYQSAAELAKDLQRFVEDRPIQARPVSRVEQSWRWCKRNPVVAALIALVLAVTVTGFAATVGQMEKAKANAAEAQANADAAQEKEREATKQRNDAQAANEKLLDAQKQLRSTLYAAHLNLVQTAWDADNIGRVHDLLSSQIPKPGQKDLRNFEWHYWQRLCHAELSTVKLEGSDPAQFYPFGRGVSLSPDGTRLAATIPANSEGNNSQIKIWDTATGKELLTIPGPGSASSQTVSMTVTFSPDGTRLALIRGDFQPPQKGTSRLSDVHVWDAATGKELLYIPSKELLTISSVKDPNDCFVHSGSFSPDGARLVTATSTSRWSTTRLSELKVWEISSGKQLFFLPSVSGSLTNPVFSPDGKRLAAGLVVKDAEDSDRQPESRVLLWDAATGRKIHSLKGPTGYPLSVAFSPDGERIAAGYSRLVGEPGAVHVWDAGTGKELWDVSLPDSRVKHLLFSPDGKLLAGPGLQARVKVWDAATGKLQLSLTGHVAPVQDLVFRAGGRQLVSAASDRTVKAWNISLPEPSPNAKGEPSIYADHSVISPDGRCIARYSPSARPAGSGSRIRLYDTAGNELSSFPVAVGSHEPYGMAISPNGARLAGAWKRDESGPQGRYFELMVWDTGSGEELFRIRSGGAAAFSGVAFDRDNTRVAAAVSFFDPEKTGDVIIGHGVKIWDATTGKELLEIRAPSRSEGVDVAFSPDGTRVAISVSTPDERAGSPNQPSVQVWEIASGKHLPPLKGHGRELDKLTFSPDGIFVAAVSRTSRYEPDELHVWRVDSSRELGASAPAFVLKGNSGSIRGLAFSPDGQRIASAGNMLSGMGGEVKIWDTATHEELLTLRDSVYTFVSVVFSPDGQRLLGVPPFFFDRPSKIVHIWDATPLPEKP